MPSSWSSNAALDVAALLREAAQALPVHRGIAVAFSGGRDSTALLAALHALWPGRVRAIHIHHGLHAHADAWAEHCAAFCLARGIAYEARRVAVSADGTGPEAAAREVRYATLQAALGPGEILAVAHHADDQAETVLFRLLRGGGARLGMQSLRRLRGSTAESWLWRPLLAVPRAALTAYCEAQGLAYVDDPGNDDGASNTRARLRALMPELEAVVPGAASALCRQLAFQDETAEREAIQLGPDIATRLHDGTLAIGGLMAWSAARRRALLRAWLRLLGAPAPGADWLACCEQEVIGAVEDAQPELALGPWCLRRFDARLWLLPELPPVPERWQVEWEGKAPIELPGAAGWLECVAGPPRPLQLRFARPGDALALREGGKRQRLKQHFQAARVPPWERLRTPVLLCGDTPVQLGNRRLAGADAMLGESRIAWLQRGWHRRPEPG